MKQSNNGNTYMHGNYLKMRGNTKKYVEEIRKYINDISPPG